MKKDMSKKLAALSLGLSAVLLFSSGCGKKNEEPKHRNIDGKVTSIDTTTGEVRMLWYNAKEKKDMELTGTLSPDAEILINGRTAKLEDVQVDDNVSVTGRVEKHEGEPKLVALKVQISRPTDTEPAPANAAETKPQ